MAQRPVPRLDALNIARCERTWIDRARRSRPDLRRPPFQRRRGASLGATGPDPEQPAAGREQALGVPNRDLVPPRRVPRADRSWRLETNAVEHPSSDMPTKHVPIMLGQSRIPMTGRIFDAWNSARPDRRAAIVLETYRQGRDTRRREPVAAGLSGRCEKRLPTTLVPRSPSLPQCVR